MSRRQVAVALVHYPIVDRRGDLVSTAVTNLDLHDIARISRTFEVDRFYVVTPAEGQQALVGRILEHWTEGFGASYNPDRCEALSLVETVGSLETAIGNFREQIGAEPLPILTGAGRKGLSYDDCRKLAEEKPLLLIFGTGSGLAPEVFENDWPVLDAIAGAGQYNHLPVRAAVAIILDRMLGGEGA